MVDCKLAERNQVISIPKVTVLMTVYNGERYIRETIESILDQTFQDYEFVIIEDCSTDETLKIIKEYRDPRIKSIKNDKKIGLIKSLNIGIALSQGEYIARQDADDISLPDRLFEEIVFLDNNTDIAMVGTARVVINEYGNAIMNVIPKTVPTFQDICNENPFQNSSVMIRKSILLEFGGYDEQLPSCEDYELLLRISKKYKVYNIPKILCKLRIHTESLSVKTFEEQTLSAILAKRMVTNQLCENDKKGIQLYGVNYFKDKLRKDEKIYYLNRVANNYRMNDKFREAQKIYLNLFLLNPMDILSIINVFRLFFGKKITEETSKKCILLMTKCRNLIERDRKF